MGILCYNTRIMELRQAGHNIVTVMEEIQNQYGECKAAAAFAQIGSSFCTAAA